VGKTLMQGVKYLSEEKLTASSILLQVYKFSRNFMQLATFVKKLITAHRYRITLSMKIRKNMLTSK